MHYVIYLCKESDQLVSGLKTLAKPLDIFHEHIDCDSKINQRKCYPK